MTTTSTDPFDPFGEATPEEIQRAHDLVHAIIAREVEVGFSPATLAGLHIAHDVLSWVLGFKCGEPFKRILTASALLLKSCGATVWRNPPPA